MVPSCSEVGADAGDRLDQTVDVVGGVVQGRARADARRHAVAGVEGSGAVVPDAHRDPEGVEVLTRVMCVDAVDVERPQPDALGTDGVAEQADAGDADEPVVHARREHALVGMDPLEADAVQIADGRSEPDRGAHRLGSRLEPLGRRMLERVGLWTWTVLMNGMIMTVFLWHLTAFVLVMAADWLLLGGLGLGPVPGTSEWWVTRPLWIAIYVIALLPLIGIFARHERSFGPVRGGRTVPRLRAVLGVVAICAGLGATAGLTIASPEGVTGVRLWVIALVLVGAALMGFGPVYRPRQRPDAAEPL